MRFNLPQGGGLSLQPFVAPPLVRLYHLAVAL